MSNGRIFLIGQQENDWIPMYDLILSHMKKLANHTEQETES